MIDSLLEALGAIGYAFDTPGALLRGALIGRPGDRASGREMLEALGYGANKEGLDLGDVLGFGAEMVLDPLNLLPGYAALRGAKHLKKTKALNKASDALLEAGGMPAEIAAKTLARDPVTGQPTRLHHGTGTAFDSFNPSFNEPGLFNAGDEVAAYMTDSGDLSSQYANNYIRRAQRRGSPIPPANVRMQFVDVRNPFNMDAPAAESTEELLQKAVEITEAYDNMAPPEQWGAGARSVLTEISDNFVTQPQLTRDRLFQALTDTSHDVMGYSPSEALELGSLHFEQGTLGRFLEQFINPLQNTARTLDVTPQQIAKFEESLRPALQQVVDANHAFKFGSGPIRGGNLSEHYANIGLPADMSKFNLQNPDLQALYDYPLHQGDLVYDADAARVLSRAERESFYPSEYGDGLPDQGAIYMEGEYRDKLDEVSLGGTVSPRETEFIEPLDISDMAILDDLSRTRINKQLDSAYENLATSLQDIFFDLNQRPASEAAMYLKQELAKGPSSYSINPLSNEQLYRAIDAINPINAGITHSTTGGLIGHGNEYLRDLGYDAIQHRGGRTGGYTKPHNVTIPFDVDQIYSPWVVPDRIAETRGAYPGAILGFETAKAANQYKQNQIP